MVIGYKEDDQPDKDDIEVQRNSEFVPTWYISIRRRLVRL